jgi:hypothetical protein
VCNSYWVRKWSNIIEGNVCKYGYYVNMDIMSNFVSLHTNYTEMKGIRSMCNVYCWIMNDTEIQKWKIKGFTIKFCTVYLSCTFVYSLHITNVLYAFDAICENFWTNNCVHFYVCKSHRHRPCLILEYSHNNLRILT